MPPPGPRQIDSWERAEENAAAWMRWWGFADAAITGSGTDGGVDVRSASALAQVKYEAHQVGRPALQRLVGARPRHGEHSLLFFSGAGYSEPAIAHANEWDVALFKYALDGSMTPVNAAARLLLRTVEEREAAARRAAEEARLAREAAERRARAAAADGPAGPSFGAAASRPTIRVSSTRLGATSPEARKQSAARPSMAEQKAARLAKKREKLARSRRSLKRRHPGRWTAAALLCLALAIYALVDGLRFGHPGWGSALAVFTVLFLALAAATSAAEEHNKLVDELTDPNHKG